MKKFRILSALLAAIMALSCLSISAVSAAETTELAITNIPDNICYSEIEDMLYGITIQLPDGSTIVTDEDNLEYVYSNDHLDDLGYASVNGSLMTDSLRVSLTAQAYISDAVEVNAICNNYIDFESFYYANSSVPYPSDFENLISSAKIKLSTEKTLTTLSPL